MRFLFDDRAADYETLRAVGYTATGGAEIGEVVTTATKIEDSSPDAWWSEWNALAERIRRLGDEAAADERWATAAASWLRASNYYRTAEFFLHGDPSDPRIRDTSAQAVGTFRNFARLHPGHEGLPHSIELGPRTTRSTELAISELAIPFNDAFLPGWWLTPSTPKDRPTLVSIGGFDSTAEEMFFTVGRVAVAHGWNCLIFDGPGQGRVIREQGTPFRHDWEAPMAAVLDAVSTFPGVDTARIALIGMSQGGYFAPRAAAFDDRPAAVVAWDGVYDCTAAMGHLMPGTSPYELLDQGRDAEVDAAVIQTSEQNPSLRWLIGNGMWTYGATKPSEYIRLMRNYSLSHGLAERIQCPVLVFDAGNDHFAGGQPDMLAEHLTAPYEIIRMPTDDGAGEHCNAGSLNRFHAALFDWLNQNVAETQA